MREKSAAAISAKQAAKKSDKAAPTAAVEGEKKD